jgi:hypothetical protein
MKIVRIPIVLSILLLFVGCGPKLEKATGTVKVDGKLINQGTIGFYPILGGRPSMAEVQADGTFELSFLKPGDGLPAGEYKVTAVCEVWKEDKKSAERERARLEKLGQPMDELTAIPGVMEYIVPVLYGNIETTPLRQTVKPGQNKFDIEIDTNCTLGTAL